MLSPASRRHPAQHLQAAAGPRAEKRETTAVLWHMLQSLWRDLLSAGGTAEEQYAAASFETLAPKRPARHAQDARSAAAVLTETSKKRHIAAINQARRSDGNTLSLNAPAVMNAAGGNASAGLHCAKAAAAEEAATAMNGEILAPIEIVWACCAITTIVRSFRRGFGGRGGGPFCNAKTAGG